jgi:undecaprenyl-diphosphatase
MDTLIIFGAKYLYLAAVAALVAYFFYLPQKKQMALFTLVSFAAAYVVAKLGGYLYYNPRPFVSDGVTPLVPHAPDNGFPSDHVLFVSAIASVLYCYNRALGIAVFCLAAAIGASRVLAGIHHWVDVAGAAGIAILSTFAVFLLTRTRLFAPRA